VAEKGKSVRLDYQSDFDTNGLIYFIGTNGQTTEWTNPGAVNLVQVWSSDGQRIPYGSVEDILSRDVNPMNCHTSDVKDAHFTIDLGVYIKPSAYTLRHARGYGKSALRTWDLEGSEDNKTYFFLKRHHGDKSLNECGSTATFFLDDAKGKSL
jgi:E3 ubiquitin-protein ligase HECTD1